MSESVSGISRSGRVRKKSAKLMEMEDLDAPDAESELDARNRKKLQMKTPLPGLALFPSGEEMESDGISRRVAPIKIWSRPPGSLKQAPDGTGGSSAVVLTAVPASGYISDHPNLTTPSGRNIESKVNKKTKSKPEPTATKVMSPLKVNVGEFPKPRSSEEQENLREDSSLRLKLILSPKEKGSSGETDFSSSEITPSKSLNASGSGNSRRDKKKRKKSPKSHGSASKGVKALDLLAAGGMMESSAETKTKVKMKKPPGKSNSKTTVKKKIPSMPRETEENCDSPDLDIRIGDHELDDDSELVIAETVPKITKKKKKGSSASSRKSSETSGKIKVKTELEPMNAFFPDVSSDADDVDSNNTALSSNSMSHSHSVYLTEKKKGKKKKQGKVVSITDKLKKGRPMTAYMLWCREHRRRIVAENPDMDFATISRRLGEAWQSLHDKEKLSWRRKAKKMSAKTSSNLISTSRGMRGGDSSRSGKMTNKQQKLPSTDSDGSVHLRDLYKVVGIAPIDVAAHLKLLGESLSIIGQRLTEHEGQIAVSGSLSVLLDSTLCALGPLLCLTAEVPETTGCSHEKLGIILDNIAYIMPGL